MFTEIIKGYFAKQVFCKFSINKVEALNRRRLAQFPGNDVIGKYMYILLLPD